MFILTFPEARNAVTCYITAELDHSGQIVTEKTFLSTTWMRMDISVTFAIQCFYSLKLGPENEIDPWNEPRDQDTMLCHCSRDKNKQGGVKVST